MRVVTGGGTRMLVLAFLIAVTATGPLKAQEKVNPIMSHDLEGDSSKEVLMYTVDFPAGFSSPVHRHNAQVHVYVLEGSVVMQVRGGKEVDPETWRQLLRKSERHSRGQPQCQRFEAGEVPCVPDQGKECSGIDTSEVRKIDEIGKGESDESFCCRSEWSDRSAVDCRTDSQGTHRDGNDALRTWGKEATSIGRGGCDRRCARQQCR